MVKQAELELCYRQGVQAAFEKLANPSQESTQFPATAGDVDVLVARAQAAQDQAGQLSTSTPSSAMDMFLGRGPKLTQQQKDALILRQAQEGEQKLQQEEQQLAGLKSYTEGLFGQAKGWADSSGLTSAMTGPEAQAAHLWSQMEDEKAKAAYEASLRGRLGAAAGYEGDLLANVYGGRGTSSQAAQLAALGLGAGLGGHQGGLGGAAQGAAGALGGGVLGAHLGDLAGAGIAAYRNQEGPRNQALAQQIGAGVGAVGGGVGAGLMA